jgi:arabinofuranan 3-O-arabinosyltransferase
LPRKTALTGSLLGGALLSLERRPALAGIFIGCLTYKPQFGILFPVALVAARQWRAIAGAAITAALLAGMSAALFGTRSWALFPHELVAQTGLNFLSGDDSNWGYLQSGYGLARLLHAGIGLAWLVHGLIAMALAIIIWRVWRSAACWRLKAASLSAAALLATPYAFAYDMAALAIPAAFLATDQLERGLLPGDKDGVDRAVRGTARAARHVGGQRSRSDLWRHANQPNDCARPPCRDIATRGHVAERVGHASRNCK